MQYAGYNYLMMILFVSKFLEVIQLTVCKRNYVFDDEDVRNSILSSSYSRRWVIPLEGTDWRREEDLSLQHLFISGVQCTCWLIWFWSCFLNTGLDAEIQKALCRATLAPKDHQGIRHYTLTCVLDWRFPLVVVMV